MADSLDERETVVESGRRPRRWRTVLIALLLIVIAAGAAGGAGWKFARQPAEPAAPQNATPTGIAAVKRQTLEEHTQVDGHLGYEGGYDVINWVDGVLTKLPTVGQVLKSGQVMYRVDNKPVILLKGNTLPAYRTLSMGMSGTDVKQLNAALVALGYNRSYGPSATSNYYGSSTKDAMVRLQDALDVTENGRLTMGEVVFLPTDQIRVTAVSGVYDGPAPNGQKLLQATSMRRVVSVAMDASLAATVKAGDKATVELPTGDVAAVVNSIGRVATTTETGTTIPVNVRLKDEKAAAGLDAATVKVVVTSASRKDVLAVPVTALLAKAGGGYSVEVVEADNSHHLTPVTIGMIDGVAGMVEVTGSDLTEGQNVVVPE